MSIAMIGLSLPAVCMDFSPFTEKQETTPQKFSPRVQALTVCNPVLWPSNSTTSQGRGRGVGRTFGFAKRELQCRALQRARSAILARFSPSCGRCEREGILVEEFRSRGALRMTLGYNDVHVLRGCGRRAETNPRGSTRDQRTSRMNRAVP